MFPTQPHNPDEDITLWAELLTFLALLDSRQKGEKEQAISLPHTKTKPRPSGKPKGLAKA
jgi:hypothetical protein